jgi:hypothetical protein
MRFRMYNTDLITAYPDGRVVFNTDGWHDRPTTKVRFNEALRYLPVPASLYQRKVFGVSQPVLHVKGKSVLFYDGLTIDGEGTITSPLRHFERRQVNKAETQELRDELKESGFTDAFKILHAASTEDDAIRNYTGDYRGLGSIAAAREAAHDWPIFIGEFAWVRGFNNQTGRYGATKRTAKETWAAIMNQLKKDMYEVVKTDITVL